MNSANPKKRTWSLALSAVAALAVTAALLTTLSMSPAGHAEAQSSDTLAAPTGLSVKASPDSSTTLQLTWNAVTLPPRALNASYAVQVSESGADGPWESLGDTNNLSYLHSGLNFEDTRHYRVRATATIITGVYLETLTGEWGTPASGTTALAIPAAVTANPYSRSPTSSLLLDWEPVEMPENTANLRYNTQVSRDGSSWHSLATTSRDQTDVIFSLFNGLRPTPGSLWYFRVQAEALHSGVWKPSAWSSAIPGATMLNPPWRLIARPAVGQGGSALHLEWEGVNRSVTTTVFRYSVQVSETGAEGSWSELTNRATRESYTHTGLAQDVTRYYRVRAEAQFASGQRTHSEWSDPASGTTLTPTSSPLAPLDLYVAPATHDAGRILNVTWDAVAAPPHATEFSYSIQVKDTNVTSSDWTLLATGLSRAGYTHEGLAPQSRRAYRVRAEALLSNAQRAVSGWSESESFATRPVPAAPQVSIEAPETDRTGSLNLSWNAVEPPETVTSFLYKIEESPSGAADSWSKLTSVDTTEYTHSGLAPATTRHYRVRAAGVNIYGQVLLSEWTTITGSTMGPPGGVAVQAHGSNPHGALQVSWNPVGLTSGANGISYEIDVSSDGATWRQLATGLSGTNHVHDLSYGGTLRHYRVRTVVYYHRPGTETPHSYVRSDWSETAKGSTTIPAPTGLNLQESSIGDPSTYLLSWQLDNAPQGMDPHRHDIQSSSSDGVWSDVETRLAVETSLGKAQYRVSKQGVATRTLFRVRATRQLSDGTWTASAWTETSLGMSPLEFVPPVPANTAVWRLQDDPKGTLVLSWDPVTAPAGYMVPDRVTYVVERQQPDGSAVQTQKTGTPTLTYPGLDPFTTLSYRVKAIAELPNGNTTHGQWSSRIEGTTEPENPAAPTVVVTPTPQRQSTHLTVSWQPVALPPHATAIQYYVAVSFAPSMTPAGAATLSGTSWTTHVKTADGMQGGADDTNYFQVQAVAEFPKGFRMESPWSPLVPGTTAQSQAAPLAPREFRVASAPADPRGTLELTWHAVNAPWDATAITYSVSGREFGSEDWTTLATGLAETAYTHTGLPPGTFMDYSLQAVAHFADGKSNSSTQVVQAGATYVEPPTGLTVAPAPDDKSGVLVLNWNSLSVRYAPLGLVWYAIQVSDTGDDGSWTDVVDSLPNATFRFSRLDGDITRHFRIKVSQAVVNGARTASDWSPSASGTTKPINLTGILPPSERGAHVPAPTGLTVEPAPRDQYGALTLKWEAITPPANATDVIYVIESPAINQNSLKLTSAVRRTNYTHRGLDSGMRRYYWVTALVEVAPGRWAASPRSPPVTGTTLNRTLAGLTPTGLEANAASYDETGTLELSWHASPAKRWVSPGYDFSRLTYSVQVSETGDGGPWTDLVTGLQDPAYIHAGLDHGTIRHYRVQTVVPLQGGKPSVGRQPLSSGWAFALGKTFLETPTGVAVTQSPDNPATTLEVRWDAVAVPGSSNVTYRIQTSDSGDKDAWSDLASLSDRVYVHSVGDPGTTVYYRVQVTSNFPLGEQVVSHYSPTVSGITATYGAAPPIPQGLTVERATADETGKLELTWDAVAAPFDSIALTYSVAEVNDLVGDADYSELATGLTEPAYTHTGLAPGTLKYYRVQAVAQFSGEQPVAVSDWGPAGYGITQMTTPPALTVNPSPDDETGTLVISFPETARPSNITAHMYHVQVSDTGTDGSWSDLTRRLDSFLVDDGLLTVTESGLEPHTTRYYRFRVEIGFANGIGLAGPWSQAVSGKTEGDNHPPEGAPAITGTAQVGEKLRVDTSSISDSDGLDKGTFNYQWLSDGADISKATYATYVLVEGDVGKAISVRVSFTDGAGNAESLTSAATKAVTAAPAVSFVIYHDPDAGDAAVDRYNQGVKSLKSAGIAYTVVVGDVQDDIDRLTGVTDSVIPRFFLGDPTDDDWTSQPGDNNGGLRWLKKKVAELTGG